MKKLALATIIISISMSLVGCNNATNLTTENKINEKITIDQAKEIALQHANLTSNQVSFIRTESEIDNGIEKYNIEFYSGNTEYDYEIDASNGNILEYDQDVENYNIQAPLSSDSTQITIEQAKDIALKHANLTSDQVSFIRIESDIDNGVKKYNVEFYSGNTEYDYEIDAANGNILEYDQDVENYNIQQPINTDTVQITIEEAKDIALKNANLTNDQVTFTEVKLDIENGIQKYELEFYNNNKEYSYEIDANTGKILSYEQD